MKIKGFLLAYVNDKHQRLFFFQHLGELAVCRQPLMTDNKSKESVSF